MASQKHVLLLSSWYPTRENPFLGNFVERYAKLIAKKYQVTLLYVVSDSNINALSIQDSQSGNLLERIAYYPKSKNKFVSFYRKYKAFHEALKSIEHVDIVHGNICFPSGWQFLNAKKRFRCELVLSEYGSIFRTEKRNQRSFTEKIILSRLKKEARIVTAVSNTLIDDMQFDFKKDNIRLLPCIVDTNIFYPNKHAGERSVVNFLHVSTLDESFKNPKGIIDACALLNKGRPGSFKMTIVSDESYEKWKNYAAKLNLLECIEFDGPFNEQELSSYYNKSDAFVLFSIYESFSIVVAEAWSCGIPVIATNVGIAKQMPEFLGVNVPFGDVETLAIEMGKFIEKSTNYNPKEISSFAKSNYSEEKVLSIADEIYKNL